MKKTLIALAALAATGAFAQVSVTGVMDAGYNVTTRANGVASSVGSSTATVGSSNSIAQSGSATTAIIITGTEDLGGGMKAGFRYEMNPDFVAGAGLTDSTTSARNGYNNVNLSGAFGTVEFGRLNTATLAANGIANPFGTTVGGGYATMTNFYNYQGVASTAGTGALGTVPTRFNNSFKYATPNLSGFTGQIIYVPKAEETGATSTNRQGVMELGLNYTNGPLAAQFASQVVEGVAPAPASANVTLAAGEKSTLNTLAVSYQVLPALKLAGAYMTHKTDGDKADATGLRLSGVYTMGKMDFMASVANINDKRVADQDRAVVGLGLDYNLSAKTAIYGRYESLESNKNAAVDTKVNQTMVGLRVKF